MGKDCDYAMPRRRARKHAARRSARMAGAANRRQSSPMSRPVTSSVRFVHVFAEARRSRMPSRCASSRSPGRPRHGAGSRPGRRARAAVSGEAGQAGHPVPARRLARQRRPPAGAEDLRIVGPADRRREPARRRRQRRRRRGREVAGRRLHRRDGRAVDARGQSEPVSEDALRRGEGLRADQPGRDHAERARRQREPCR